MWVSTFLRERRYRTYFFTTYSLGLRLSEALALHVGDIESAHGRVHVRRGKGCKDRLVPLPDLTLQALRRHWSGHRHPILDMDTHYLRQMWKPTSSHSRKMWVSTLLGPCRFQALAGFRPKTVNSDPSHPPPPSRCQGPKKLFPISKPNTQHRACSTIGSDRGCARSILRR